MPTLHGFNCILLIQAVICHDFVFSGRTVWKKWISFGFYYETLKYSAQE